MAFLGWLHGQSSPRRGGHRTEPDRPGKKGTKRSLHGDANRIPLALTVAGANVHDMVLVPETLDNIMAFRPMPTPENEQNLYMDKGYDYTKTNCQVRQRGFTPHIRHCGEERLAYQSQVQNENTSRQFIQGCAPYQNQKPAFNKK